MAQPTDSDHKPFAGDRYERFMQAAKIISIDPSVINAPLPYNTEGIMAFASSVCEARLLDGMTDHDCDTVSMLTLLDFMRGVPKMAWRLTDWMSDTPSADRQDDDPNRVLHALAGILTMTLHAFVRPSSAESEGAN
jgi:hypothetical protein